MFGMMEGILSFLRRQIGLRTDAASASGSALARLKDIRDNRLQTAIGASTDNRDSNTVMGWLKSSVKSVQRGATTFGASTTTATATITSVTTGKTLINITGVRYDSNSESGLTFTGYTAGMVTVLLTNATTITFTKGNNVIGSQVVTWEVIEYY